MVRTAGFQPVNGGSIPPGSTITTKSQDPPAGHSVFVFRLNSALSSNLSQKML